MIFSKHCVFALFLSIVSNVKGFREQDDERIVDGVQVSPEAYPYFVWWEDPECGGTLIHGDIVLSAAHVSASWLSVRLLIIEN